MLRLSVVAALVLFVAFAGCADRALEFEVEALDGGAAPDLAPDRARDLARPLDLAHAPDLLRPIACCDGTASPSCWCGGPLRRCCSWHGGVCGCK